MQRKDKSKSRGIRHDKVVIFLMSLFMLIALALGVNASSCSFATPANNGYLTFGSLLNFTIDDLGTTVGVVVIHINASSASTANSSSFEILAFTNETKATNMPIGSMNVSINGTLGAFILEPSDNYVLTAWMENVTGSSGAIACNATRTEITIDRGDVPSAPTSTTPTASSDNTTSQNIVFNANVNGANTTGCTLRFIGTSSNPGQSVYAMTHSGSTCTLTINNVARSSYTYFMRASDGTNTSDSANTIFTVSQGTSQVGKRAYIISQQGGQEPTKEGVERALGIAQPEDAGVNVDIKGELTGKELTKTGIGVGSGAVAGMMIGSFVLPGIGTIAGLPLGAIVGGVLGFLA